MTRFTYGCIAAVLFSVTFFTCKVRVHSIAKESHSVAQDIRDLIHNKPLFFKNVGRVTQKYPGVAENGSVYNHTAAFYTNALYKVGLADDGYEGLKSMLPNYDSAE